jgi:hypothetical protein
MVLAGLGFTVTVMLLEVSVGQPEVSVAERKYLPDWQDCCQQTGLHCPRGISIQLLRLRLWPQASALS